MRAAKPLGEWGEGLLTLFRMHLIQYRQLRGLALGLLCTGLPEPIERNPFNCVRLSSGFRTQFNTS